MLNATKIKYLSIAEDYTENELATILNVHPRTIRRYAKEFGVKPKTACYRNRTLAEWKDKFNKFYEGKLVLTAEPVRDAEGHVKAKCRCLNCGTEWNIDITDKLNTKTGCIKCDKGNFGNKYTHYEVLSMLNDQYENRWTLLQYGHYSQKDSIIKCNLCGHEQTVNLSDFINTTSKRCTCCQTGSFGEYVIANTLLYNAIPFEKEKHIRIKSHTYRLDFLINDTFAVEYSGRQHFDNSCKYYNKSVNEAVRLKRDWCLANGYTFHEIVASKTMKDVIKSLETVMQRKLMVPTPEFLRKNNPDMQKVLAYMRVHSARQTERDLRIPKTKIQHYVYLEGYQSISDWQSDNKIN